MTKLGFECNPSSSRVHSYKLLGGKPCTCPALRLKKKPRISDRDINGLRDSGILSKVVYPTVQRQWEGHESSLHYSGKKRLPSTAGKRRQVGSVTREASTWGKGQAHGLLIGPYNKRSR